MFDEFEYLCETPELLQLLGYYAEAGRVNREAWQDRVMELEELSTKELSRMHGELIAFGWIEQNTGLTPVLKPGVAGGCYRVTAAGLRTYKEARSAKPQAAR